MFCECTDGLKILGFCFKSSPQSSHVFTDLVMHEDVHDVQIDLREPVILRFVGEQDVLDAEQRDKDEGRPHRPHVQAGLCVVCHSQLGDEDPNDVQQEEKVHLEF